MRGKLLLSIQLETPSAKVKTGPQVPCPTTQAGWQVPTSPEPGWSSLADSIRPRLTGPDLPAQTYRPRPIVPTRNHAGQDLECPKLRS